ncbi:MAG: hypothetical protein HZB91_05295 [Elusimicrobia bacterium]|nr:hypothetical protein [Elusimicrobiota bacterium]
MAGLPQAAFAASQSESYGAKGIFPVYEVSGQWVIYDKKSLAQGRQDSRLKPGGRFLVVGSAGASVFSVESSTAGWGGACKGNKPLKLKAAVLEGPRREVGAPVIAISVPPRFNLKKSQARFRTLSNQVSEDTYRSLLGPLKALLRSEISSPAGGEESIAETAAVKIDFGARVSVAGLPDPFVIVEGAQVAGTYRRCLRLSEGGRLLGACAPMRHELMTETSRLEFVSYDPSGQGKPFILAYTSAEPLWGHERWGFALRKSGPKLFLDDSMDIRCREGF